MSAKEITINYLNSIKVNYKEVLKVQINNHVNEKYIFDTMQYLVGIEIAIKAVKEMEGE